VALVKVLLAVIDAASPRVMCPAVQTGRLPNLKRLVDAGEMHQGSITIFPSITPAATTSIVTGAYPAEHGIAGASWYDDERREVAYYGDDFWLIARRGFGAFLHDFLVRLNGDRLRASTLFELVERTGRPAACLNYLVHRGLVRHDVNVPRLMTLLPGVPFTETVDGPRVLCLGDFVTSRPLTRKAPDHGGLLHRFGMDDAATAELLIELVADGAMPDLTVAYFADNDYRSHAVGPFPALPAIEGVDAAFGAMFDAGGGFDRFMRDTCVIVTSDHGHSEILPAQDEAAIRLHAVLGDFRQADLGREWRRGDEIMICPNMRAAQIYARDPSPDLIERLARTALVEPRIDLVLWKRALTEPGAEGYMVTGPRGRLAFWRTGGRRGDPLATDAFGTGWAWRGDLEVLQIERDGTTLDTTEYPNAFERIAGALDAKNSGELWMTARPGCEFEVQGESVHAGGGSHGALHALDSLCPVIAAGMARRLPRVMRSVDIAPLCMEALGIPMRYRVGEPRTNAPTANVGR
jgi:hypothetical protein